MKTAMRILLVLLVLLAGFGIWIWREAAVFLDTPPQKDSKQIYFDVPQGANLSQIANSLVKKGLLTDARKFIWLARLKNEGHTLQAGRFALNSGWKPEQILNTLAHGKPVLYKITIPEGLTWWQTAKLLDDAGFARFNDFKAVIFDPVFLRHYGIPFNNAEGFLMPDTYLLKRPETDMPPGNFEPRTEEENKVNEEWRRQAKNVAARMVDNFWRKTSAIWPPGGIQSASYGNMPKSGDLKKWVILASIVEKETAIDKERPRVAGVYANRMADGMLLQADPTVIYGLGPDFSGPLLRRHLNDPSNPYNTYQIGGLPPGPISSFGVAALKAAVYPEKHNYLYFVAITDGGAHTFSRTLNEHNQAVREYRQRKANKDN